MKTQIIVVGGGAGGLQLVRRLGARFGRRRHDIILVERNRTHIWKPLLHEVAAGSLDANLDEVGYRNHCYRWGYRFFRGTFEGIDREKREVLIAPLLDEDGSELVAAHRIRYDYLVIAAGSVSNDFGTPGAREHCLFLDDRAGADRFRHRLLDHCLRVSRSAHIDPRSEARVRIAIVGGGATGVELAAELYNAAGALRHYGLEVFDESRLEVSLIEAGDRILPALPPALSATVVEELKTLGVSVMTGTKVTQVTARAVVTPGGEIPADLKVWAAGVKADDRMAGLGGLATNMRNQLIVRGTLQVEGDDRIFAIGDCAACAMDGDGRLVPPRAQAAHQMASSVYRNLLSLMDGRPLKHFVYRDHGSLVSLSRFSTIGSLMGNLVGGRLAVEGRLARFVYTSLYRLHLIGIHGWLRGLGLIAIGQVHRIVRPKLKLH